MSQLTLEPGETFEMTGKSIGKAKLITKGGRTRVVASPRRQSVSQKIGAKAKADRLETGYRKNREKRA